jgi:3-deoxy-D-manno-octulosonic-acid transferase
MGEMLGYYLAAHVAFVGGSLLPLGGQNLLEPIALGVPTLFGPHTHNFAEAAAQAVAAGAAARVDDAAMLVRKAGDLLRAADERARMRERALAFIDTHRGSADRLWQWLKPRIEAAHARRAPADRSR